MNFLIPIFISLIALFVQGSFIRSTSFSPISSESNETTEGPKRIQHGRNATTITSFRNETISNNGTSSNGTSTNCSCTFPARLAYCGSDGVTYDSACKFRCASRVNADLKLVKRGPCDGSDSKTSEESSEPPHHVFSFITNLFHKNNHDEKNADSGKFNRTNGAVKFNLTNGEKNTNIAENFNKAVVQISSSTSDETGDFSSIGNIRSSTAKNSAEHFLIEKRESEKPCICPYYYDPICGIDGHLYGNECELDCHQVKRKYPSNDKSHQGKC